MPAPTPILLTVSELGIGGSERQVTETAKSLDRSLFAPHAMSSPQRVFQWWSFP
jgi:hypothetical protein